jgi:hypothetical protein
MAPNGRRRRPAAVHIVVASSRPSEGLLGSCSQLGVVVSFVSQKSIAHEFWPVGCDETTSLARGPGGLSSAGRDILRSSSVLHSAGSQLDRSPAGRSDRVLARRESYAAGPARAQASSVHRCRATVARPQRKAPRPKASGRGGVARDAGDHPSVVPRPGRCEVRRKSCPRQSGPSSRPR